MVECLFCHGPTREHCRGGRCGWVVCIARKCGAIGDPRSVRWTPGRRADEAS